MRFTLLVASLLCGTAFTQYVAGGTGSAVLPTNPAGGANTDNGSGNNGNTVPKVDVPSFPKADLTKFVVGSTNAQQTALNLDNTINGARKELSTPVRSVESLFTRVPSKSELNKLADDGDTAGILKTLQTLASDDSIPCGTKVSYLLEVLASVKDAIARKNLAADQLAAIIDGAKAEIARLQAEIDRIQKDRDYLGLPDLQSRVNDLVNKLKSLYDQINAIKAQIPPEEARVAGYEKEISTLNAQNADERNRLSNDRLKLVDTQNLIKDLENRLRDARDQQAALEASIAASEAIIKGNNDKIANIRTTIAEINAKIKSLQDTLDKLKRLANSSEVDLERARTDLSVALVKDTNWGKDIKDLQAQINAQQPKLVDDDLKKLRTLIANLNSSLPQIQSEIDREYYYCYGAGKVDTVKTGNVIVYVVKGEAFGQYIQNAYGQSVGAPQLRTGDDYRLQVVDPFSKIWTAKFGYPSNAGSQGGNFSCLNNNSGSTGRGTISGVSADGFTVKDGAGKSVKLGFGSCSRV